VIFIELPNIIKIDFKHQILKYFKKKKEDKQIYHFTAAHTGEVGVNEP